ncbi:unnamed protein product [Amaranthus hypochondriacus]
MECLQGKKKKGSILKKSWERCKSFNDDQPQRALTPTRLLSITPLRRRPMVKSKSWSTFFPTTPLSPRVEKLVGSNKNNSRVGLISPKGCLSVYVGPDKQRFVLKIECTNHPLFRMLLEEAESVYGFQNDGPLLLPCEVHIFLKILYEMDANDDYDDQTNTNSRCRFPRNRSSYHLLNPSNRLIS